MLSEDIFYLPISELGVRIRSRRLSPVELTEGYLDRIHRYGTKLNAFATVTPDLALTQARAAEREIHSGRYRGPLHGIPYAAKDLLATAGIKTGWGAHPTRDQIPDKDATVVRKLRDAGAVLLGKAAMVEFAGCLGYRFADASLTGPGRNPWDPERWTGGSSSGSGAAVASALVGFAIGTETWGSILCPSAFCGVTGLRPTYGRVSRAGGMVGAYTFDKIGPMARSAADCRVVLQAIAGPDPDDPSASTEPLRLDRGGVELSRLRGALVPLDFTKTKGAEPEVKAAFDRAVADLGALGLKLEEAKLPDFPASEMASLIINAEALSTFENYYKNGGVWELKDPYAPYQREITRALNGADLVKAWRMRTLLQERIADFFSRYDVIVTPNFMSVAPSIRDDLVKALPYPDPVGAIGNSCGLPSIALPCGFGKGRMPAGFQIMGSAFEEGTLLHLGEAFQSRTAFHRERPPLFV
ncbi:MAG: amidase [Candidatus Eisenbacteria bacterium]|uniref:Amidase n=1 Tax=Eiseniibacteriota bacterium TaxID=2212470 RepID=A0A538T730_UNCEI|nr:MAG: amidase [Candidatus Eisenbacteria bacterium]